MSYSIHDWFDDFMTPDKLKEYMVNCNSSDPLHTLETLMSLSNRSFKTYEHIQYISRSLIDGMVALETGSSEAETQDKLLLIVSRMFSGTKFLEIHYRVNKLKVSVKPRYKLFNNFGTNKRAKSYCNHELLKHLYKGPDHHSKFDLYMGYIDTLRDQNFLVGLLKGLSTINLGYDSNCDTYDYVSLIIGLLHYDGSTELDYMKIKTKSGLFELKEPEEVSEE